MLLNFNGFSSILSSVYNNLISIFSYYYLCTLSLSLMLFLSYRFPYCFSPMFFGIFLLTFIFSSFLSLFLRRLIMSPSEFFSGFVPIGTPIFICPLVCIAETVSFFIRPFVLVIRPFVNISLGCFGAVALSSLCFTNSVLLFFLALVFFYEVFVALVHWFIVANILSFSVDH